MGIVNIDVVAKTFHDSILCYNIANNKVICSHNTVHYIGGIGKHREKEWY